MEDPNNIGSGEIRIDYVEDDCCSNSSCSSKLMTIDEAIEHANEIASKSNTICGKNHKQLSDWLVELKETRSKYMYLAADFDNYKKRMSRERTNIINSANKDIITDLLAVVDDMERLLETTGKDDVGFKMIHDNLIKLLENEGCEKIKCTWGDKFDPNIHESMMVRDIRDDEGYDPGDIVEILQSGWVLNGKLIRPVKVAVGK